MNHLIIFVLSIAMCFGLNEGMMCSTGNSQHPRCRDVCLLNTLEIRNELGPDNILMVKCTSNRNEVKELYDEGGGNRIVWRCHLRQGQKMEYFQDIWRAYRGASQSRCGQIRTWIAKPEGIYLVRNNEPKGLKHPWNR
ncbi:hypothetical protein EUTSA_v10014983mg [Eutrema salsugineum]|uniref:Uncharacterized protein n=1 Tax=Eutrema salsugineum TaxID=72664 RepID=V4LIN8_EUTSA|nr:hypothetical protein EUTSA_v10014983mg [Eutrema salsugineum]